MCLQTAGKGNDSASRFSVDRVFDQVGDIINALDAEEKASALFFKNNWKRFENLGKKFEKLELEMLRNLADVLEPLALIRTLDSYLKENQNLDQKLNAEQLNFDLLNAYSKLSGYSNPPSSWKKWVSIQANVKGKPNAREFLKASMCCSQLHKLLSEMRPIMKAVASITSQEMKSLFAKRKQLVQEVEKALGSDKVIKELLSSRKPRPLISSVSAKEEVTKVSQEEVEEENPPETVSGKQKSYPDALLLIAEDLQRSIKSISSMVPAAKRHFLQSGAMKLSLLIAELLSASQGLCDAHRRFHAMTVAKYIHGALQELLTALLENPTAERVHSLTALAKRAKVDGYAELFRRYDNAGAAARRPQQYDAFSEKQELLQALIALDSLLDHFALAQSPLQSKFAELFEIISSFEPASTSIGEKPSRVVKVIDLLKQKLVHPAAKQCLEYAVWNLEMLDYRLAQTRVASLASSDLLVNECFDLFHTVSELVLRARMIQDQLYSSEKEVHQELGHSLLAHVLRSGFSLEQEDVKEFIKEYDLVSFTRFSSDTVAKSAESIAQETRKVASLQRRLLGQRGYAELTQVWEELEWEMRYNIPENGFTVSSSRSTKKALQTQKTALEKVSHDADVLLKLLTLVVQGF